MLEPFDLILVLNYLILILLKLKSPVIKLNEFILYIIFEMNDFILLNFDKLWLILLISLHINSGPCALFDLPPELVNFTNVIWV